MDINDKKYYTNEQLITILQDMIYFYNFCNTERIAIKECIDIIESEDKRQKLINNLIKIK